ncbi:MAG TPA: PEP-CTERM sorting domain-containing protein [Opitutaceae bacterium]|nr:PEP-CTERM sorting domain-containing protein [Opitutaceae bacterium]
MKSGKILFVLSALLLACTALRAQLVVNGGFETGSFANWTLAGTAEVKTGSPGSAFVYEGAYGATLGSGILSQAFVTTPGQVYHVEFLLNAILFADPGPVEARWGNFDIPNNLDLGHVTLFQSPDIPGLGWYKYEFSLLALGNVSSLAFEFQTQAVFYPDNIALDGVSVSALPDFFSLPVLNGVPIGDPSPLLTSGRPYLLSSSVTAAAVPEPATFGLFGALGLAALVTAHRKRAVSRRPKN